MAVSTGTQSKSAISAISMLDKRDILKKAVDVQNEEGLADILHLADLYKETTQAEYHDYAEDPLFQLLVSTATITGSGTTTITVPLTAGSSGYAVKGQQVLFPDGGVGYVYSVTPSGGIDTLVIKSVNGGNLTLTAGQSLSPSAIVVGEGSAETTNQRFGFTKYSNLVQTFRDVNKITDIQMISDVELEFEGSNYIWNHDIASKFIKFKGGINAAFISGKKGSTKFSDASPSIVDPGAGGGAMQFTGGLNEYVGTYGSTTNAATPGTLALSDLETTINALIANRSTPDHMVLASSKALAKVSNCLKNLGSSTSVSSARLDVNGREIDFNVEKFSYMGFNLDFTLLPILNHPVHFSQTDIPKYLYFVPKGKVNTRDGSSVDRISVRYMKNPIKGFGNDIYAEWDTGAMARGGATSGDAVRATHWLSTQGLHMVGVAQFGRLKVL